MSTDRGYALVTGASGGIGAAIGVELARMGHPVLVHYHSNEAGAGKTAELISKSGGMARLVQFDVTDEEAVENAMASWRSDEIDVSVLVNNAGIIRDGMFAEMSAENWATVTRTAIDGFYNVTRRLVLPMVRRRWGRIVSIASAGALLGTAGQVNYSAAKAALVGATRSLAREVAARGVTVNVVAPGYIDTGMLDGLLRDEIIKRIGVKRLGTPGEVAKLVGFIASDDASYITGQTLCIDGGVAMM